MCVRQWGIRVTGILVFFALVAGAVTTPSALGQTAPHKSGSIFDDDAPPMPNPVRQPGAGPSDAPPSALPPTTAPSPTPASALPGPPPSTEPGVSEPPIPNPQPKPEDLAPGVIAEFFSDPQGTVLNQTRVTRRIYVKLQLAAEAPEVSFRWQGYLLAPAGGITVKQFCFEGASGISINGATRPTPQTLFLAEGAHRFTVTAVHVKGQGIPRLVGLGWILEGQDQPQWIPANVLMHLRSQEPAGLAALPPGSGSTSASPTPVVKKGTTPLPSESSVAPLTKEIKVRYAAYYKDTTPVVRQTLERKLTDDARRADSAAEKLALLREAADQALFCGDLPAALAVDDQIGEEFAVNLDELKLETLTAAAKGARTGDLPHQIETQAMGISDRAIEEDDLDLSLKAAQLAERASAACAGDDSTRIKGRIRDIREAQQQALKIAPLAAKLKDSPQDPLLNDKVGRFYCFSVGNWKKGLPLLAHGSSLALKSLAETEALAPAVADDQLKLGDAWWDQASKEVPAAAGKCRERAAWWYNLVRESGVDLPPRVMERLATQSRTVDVLAKIDLDKLGLLTNPSSNISWLRQPDGSILYQSTTGTYSTLVDLPYHPVGDYDYLVDLTIDGTTPHYAQLMPFMNSTVEWTVSNGYDQFVPAPRKRTTSRRDPLPSLAGHRFQSVVQVRRNGMRVLINGVVIREWSADPSYPAATFFAHRDLKAIAIGVGGAKVTIHAIKVMEIGSGHAK